MVFLRDPTFAHSVGTIDRAPELRGLLRDEQPRPNFDLTHRGHLVSVQ